MTLSPLSPLSPLPPLSPLETLEGTREGGLSAPAYRTWAEIDLSALAHNLERLRLAVGPACEVMAVVKADGYGLGATALARALSSLGVREFGVGDSSEALALAAAGLPSRIHILGAVVPDEIEACVRAGIGATLHSLDRLEEFRCCAARLSRRVRVHVKVDTGMGRLGAGGPTALEILARVALARELELDGVCSHLACAAEADMQFNRVQLERFDKFLAQAAVRGLPTGRRHVAASAAIFRDRAAHYDRVRPGLALHGLGCGAFDARAEGLRPILSWRTQVVYLKGLAEGQTVGYGCRWRARRPSLIATLPVGYADGLPPALAQGGEVLLHGVHARIVGAVSMDYTTIDVSHVPRVRVGDIVTIIGRDGEAELRAEALARRAALPVYALSCGLGRRVQRIYL